MSLIMISPQSGLPQFEMVGGAWTITSQTFTTAANGVLVPNSGGNGQACFNLNYTGVFQLRWEYSSMSGVTTAVGVEFGVFPSANFPMNNTMYSAAYDTRYLVDNPEVNYTNIYDNTSVVAQSQPKPATNQTFQISRDESNVIRIHRDGTQLHQFSATLVGAVAVGARANVNGTNLTNIRAREYYNSDWNA